MKAIKIRAQKPKIIGKTRECCQANLLYGTSIVHKTIFIDEFSIDTRKRSGQRIAIFIG